MTDLRVRWFFSSACRPNSPSFLSDQLALAQRFSTWKIDTGLLRLLYRSTREVMTFRNIEPDTELFIFSDLSEGNKSVSKYMELKWNSVNSVRDLIPAVVALIS